MTASERPPVTVHFHGTTCPTPEQQQALIAELDERREREAGALLDDAAALREDPPRDA